MPWKKSDIPEHLQVSIIIYLYMSNMEDTPANFGKM